MTTFTGSGLSMFEIAAYRTKSVRLLRQETIELSSGPVVCQVIEVEQESPNDRMQYSPLTYWIDTSRNLVLKMNYKVTIREADRPTPSESIITVSFPKATVGQGVDEELFRFTPPADAVQVERLSFGPKSPLVGKDAPDFELKGVDGKAITGGSLRGSMVLLQFSQRADDDALPFLEMTYRSLKGSGLAAIYVLGPHEVVVPRAADNCCVTVGGEGDRPLGGAADGPAGHQLAALLAPHAARPGEHPRGPAPVVGARAAEDCRVAVGREG